MRHFIEAVVHAQDISGVFLLLVMGHEILFINTLNAVSKREYGEEVYSFLKKIMTQNMS